MLKQGYFGGWSGTLQAAKDYAEELLTGLFASFGGNTSQPVYCRHADRDIDLYALTAWQARALALVQNEALPPYDPDEIDDAFFDKIIRSSYYSEGPRLVPELLNKRGIHFVLLPHLPKTYLDGACFLSPAGRPVIGMTLRHDRLDNFWFTLLHELAHMKLHVHEDGPAFFDDTAEHTRARMTIPARRRRTRFPRDRLIPDAVWRSEGPRLAAPMMTRMSSIWRNNWRSRRPSSPAASAGNVMTIRSSPPRRQPRSQEAFRRLQPGPISQIETA